MIFCVCRYDTNSVSFGGGNAQEFQDPGARTPIGTSGIENFELQNHEFRKSLKDEVYKTVQSQVQTKCSSQQKSGDKKIHQIDFPKPEVTDLAKMGESQPVLSNMEVVAESWVKGNDLLLGLISKLKSKARVDTTATKGKADAKPDGSEAANSEENSRDIVEPRSELNSGEVESSGIADVEAEEKPDRFDEAAEAADP